MKPTVDHEQTQLLPADVAAHTDVPFQEYAYRPGQMVVAIEDDALVRDQLTELGCEHIGTHPYAIVYRMPSDVDIPSLVAQLRSTDGPRAPRIGPNHVLFGAPRYRGSPGDDPEPADALPDPPVGEGLAGAGVRVVVLDTGVDAVAHQTEWLQPVLADDPADIDLTTDAAPVDGFIDDQAGHGGFVAGLVRQVAPGAEVRVIKVLDTEGVTDELTIAAAISRASDADVINLSLGGFCHGDQPPVAIAEAIAALPRSTAVIAAAGNFGSSRPFWPAALKRVVAVGAVDDAGAPATFSDSGWWVDACARGVDRHSVYVAGNENPSSDRHPDSFDGWATWSGTSFACATLSGHVALEQERAGGTAREAAARLLSDPSRPEVPGLGVLIE